jgi:uncharacterized protein
MNASAAMQPAATAVETAAVASALHSSIYVGHISHRRFAPRPHQFRYPLFMMYLDLAELDRVFAKRWFWSVRGRNLAEFRRSDYLGDPAQPLDAAVRDCVQAQTGQRPTGPIRMLAHLRYFGHCFNPVAFYYCYSADGRQLETIVAEITNTPWKERHAYVLPVSAAETHGSALGWSFDKRFHVSPFLPMQRRYDWRFQSPADALRVHMDVAGDTGPEFDATLVLRRRTLNAWSLARALLRYPLMTLQVVLAIHWQAFFIWCKHNPVYDHPNK